MCLVLFCLPSLVTEEQTQTRAWTRKGAPQSIWSAEQLRAVDVLHYFSSSVFGGVFVQSCRGKRLIFPTYHQPVGSLVCECLCLVNPYLTNTSPPCSGNASARGAVPQPCDGFSQELGGLLAGKRHHRSVPKVAVRALRIA